MRKFAAPIWGVMPMAAAALEVANVSAGYGAIRIISDMSFDVPAGDRLAILGRRIC